MPSNHHFLLRLQNKGAPASPYSMTSHGLVEYLESSLTVQIPLFHNGFGWLLKRVAEVKDGSQSFEAFSTSKNVQRLAGSSITLLKSPQPITMHLVPARWKC